MAFELKDGQGTLHRNDKQGNEKRPDYTGQVNLAGTFYRVSGWIKDGQRGKWLSLRMELPNERTSNVIREAPTKPDDDMPW